VKFCAKCQVKLEAFIRKPENGDPDDISPAAKVARALAAVCVSCSAGILGPAEVAGASARPAPYSVNYPLTTLGPASVPGASESAEDEPPHPEAPDQVLDGPAAIYAVTAATLPLPRRTVRMPAPSPVPRWLAGAIGSAGHAVLPPGPVPGPHGAATSTVRPVQRPGPHRAPTPWPPPGLIH